MTGFHTFHTFHTSAPRARTGVRAGAGVRTHVRARPPSPQGMEGVEGMDKAIVQIIRQSMPGVMRLVAEKRREWGDAHVTECQRRGMAGEPGWFWAREGALAIGTPWDDPDMWAVAGMTITPTQAQLWMRPPSGAGEAAC